MLFRSAIKRILFLFSIFFLLANNTSAEIKSLKNNKTNVRLGPDISYPIKWKYKKKYLPVQILDKHYNWRKIKDYEGLSLNQESEKSLKNQFVINLISGKTMLITGFNAEALDDIRRAREILDLMYKADEENVPMMIGRLDKIIYQVKEMD